MTGETCPGCVHFLDAHDADGCLATIAVVRANEETQTLCPCTRPGNQQTLV
jgi:hypothetical protein